MAAKELYFSSLPTASSFREREYFDRDLDIPIPPSEVKSKQYSAGTTPRTQQFVDDILRHELTYLLKIKNPAQHVAFDRFNRSRTSLWTMLILTLFYSLMGFPYVVFVLRYPLRHPSVIETRTWNVSVYIVQISVLWLMYYAQWLNARPAPPRESEYACSPLSTQRCASVWRGMHSKLRTYSSGIQFLAISLTMLLYCTRLILRTQGGHCPHTAIALSWNCNPFAEGRGLPMETLLMVLLSPFLLGLVARDVSDKIHMLTYLISIVTTIYCAIYIHSGVMIPLFLSYMVGSLLILFDVRRQSLTVFFMNQKLKEFIVESERLADEAHANEMRSMISNVAHDLKTPLTSLQSGVELIEQVLHEMRVHRALTRNSSSRAGPTQVLSPSVSLSQSGSHPSLAQLLRSQPSLTHFTQVSQPSLTQISQPPCTQPPQSQPPHTQPPQSQPPHTIPSPPLSPSLSHSSSLSPSLSSLSTEEEFASTIAMCAANIRATNAFMLMTINRCIDYTKASKGLTLVPHYESLSLSHTLSLPLCCMRDVQNRVQITYVAPVSVCESALCEYVFTDKQWLTENVLCLLSNAVKFSTHGEVRLSVQLCEDSRYSRVNSQGMLTKVKSLFSPSLSRSLSYSHKTVVPLNPPSQRSGHTSHTQSSHTTHSHSSHNTQVLYESGVRNAPFAHNTHTSHSRTPHNPSTQSNSLSHSERENSLSVSHTHTDNERDREKEREKSSPSLSVNNTHREKDRERDAFSPSPPLVLRFEVEDHGIGIAEEIRPSLFSPFKQAQRLAGGTGLGLYSLAKRVEALGGHCGVSERRDATQGSLFWFEIPYRPDWDTARQREKESERDGERETERESKREEEQRKGVVVRERCVVEMCGAEKNGSQAFVCCERALCDESSSLCVHERERERESESDEDSLAVSLAEREMEKEWALSDCENGSARHTRTLSLSLSHAHTHKPQRERTISLATDALTLSRSRSRGDSIHTTNTLNAVSHARTPHNAPTQDTNMTQCESSEAPHILLSQVVFPPTLSVCVPEREKERDSVSSQRLSQHRHTIPLRPTPHHTTPSPNVPHAPSSSPHSSPTHFHARTLAHTPTSPHTQPRTPHTPLSHTSQSPQIHTQPHTPHTAPLHSHSHSHAHTPTARPHNVPRLCILVVDDSPAIVKTTRMVLARHGHTALTAENGLQCVNTVWEREARWEERQRERELERLREGVEQGVERSREGVEKEREGVERQGVEREKESERRVDVVLMDLQMPVMDGIEATQRLREREREREMDALRSLSLSRSADVSPSHKASSCLQSVSSQDSLDSFSLHSLNTHSHSAPPLNPSSHRLIIIGVSAVSDPDTAQRAMSMGLDAFLHKPFSIHSFYETLSRLLNTTRVPPARSISQLSPQCMDNVDSENVQQ